jgi:hypothetical protein
MSICCINVNTDDSFFRYLAYDDCYLRSRGLYDWVLFVDVDEIASPMGGSNVSAAMDFCDNAFHKVSKHSANLTINLFKPTI